MSEPRICALEECDRPVTARQRFCSQKHQDRDSKRRRRAKPQPQAEIVEYAVDRREYARVRAAERAENLAIEREMRRIEESGEKCGFIFGVPAPASIVSILSR